jgi:hypothetical protein
MASLIAEAPTPDANSCAIDRCSEVDGAQHAHTVGLYQDAATVSAPIGAAFDNLDREALTMQSAAQSESRDSATHNQQVLDIGHVRSAYASWRT